MDEKIDLPPGWRKQDYDIWHKLCELEARINKLDKLSNSSFECEKLTQEFHVIVNDDIKDMRADIVRLNEAYYKVFPERVGQDIKFSDQMKALTAKPRREGGHSEDA